MICPNRVAIAVVAALLTGACQQEPQQQGGQQPGASASAPDSKPGLSLVGGRLVLPAVKGNPGAAYFALTNASDKPVVIAAVDIAGAEMVMFHQTEEMNGHSTMKKDTSLEIKPGQTMTLAPGGRHLMVGGLPGALEPGTTTEITLTFMDGDKLSAPLAIETPGSAN